MSRLWLLLIPALLSGSAWAANINIGGVVVASSCTVSVNTVSRTIEFSPIGARSLSEAGSGGEWTNFQLKVIDCPESVQRVTMTLSGTVDNDDATAFANSGSAQHVALRLTNSTRDLVYSNGSLITKDIEISEADGMRYSRFPLSARIFTPLGGTRGGTFVSVVNADFTYQ